jgi:hypothetical protein
MSKYWMFWRRGWWALLFIFCANLSVVALVIPFALATAFASHGNKLVYWITVSVVWFVIGVPVHGWFFERFAARSSRIVQPPLAQADRSPE